MNLLFTKDFNLSQATYKRKNIDMNFETHSTRLSVEGKTLNALIISDSHPSTNLGRLSVKTHL